jgi:hypothetical protein
MITTRHELLRQFFAGFFHQDWRVEADTPEQVVTHYVTLMNDRAALPELSGAILAFVDDPPPRGQPGRCAAPRSRLLLRSQVIQAVHEGVVATHRRASPRRAASAFTRLKPLP